MEMLCKTHLQSMKTFKILVRTSGSLLSRYVFENQEQKDDWIKNKVPELEKIYGKLELQESELPGFKIGDRCCVNGEGLDVFTILDVKEYSENRYGFLLDSGWWEEVANCYWPRPDPEIFTPVL